MGGCRDLRRVAGAVGVTLGIVGRYGLPEPREPGLRQAAADEPDGLVVRGATLLVQVGLDEQGPGRTVQRDGEPAVVAARPVERCAHVLEFGLVLVQPDRLVHGPVVVVCAIEPAQHRLRHAALRVACGRRGIEARARIAARRLEQRIAWRLRRQHRHQRAIDKTPDEVDGAGQVDRVTGHGSAATSSAKLPANVPSWSNARCSTGVSRL